mgnify:CR=1 FL=1|tara:strand:+ start:1018 stop:2337 length:1320 start_codon:yes stop_codon:yes gene_type:complete
MKKIVNNKKIKKFQSWGNNITISAKEIIFSEDIIKDKSPNLTIYGNGRSYGDCALGNNILSMNNNNGIKRFDNEKGVIECNSGTKLRDINSLIIPKGWFFPVSPGTSLATIGGCVASDVHGKNHYTNGSFSDHVISLKILNSKNEILEISRSELSEIFYATCGGMGLLGIIVSVSLKLMRINSSNIYQTEKKFTRIEDLIDAFYEHENNMYNVGWIDFLNNKSNQFRNIFMTANHGDDLIYKNIEIKEINVPFKKCFSLLLNNQGMKLFNKIYFSRSEHNRFSKINFNKFFYILDYVKDWNLLYGRNGLLQLHFVIPEKSIKYALNKIFSNISETQIRPYLATFKRYSDSNNNYLTFAKKGFGAALDFPNNINSRKLLKKLESIITDHDGKIYLCKDSLLSKENFEKSYEKHNLYKKVLKEFNPELKFNSIQSDRLGIT